MRRLVPLLLLLPMALAGCSGGKAPPQAVALEPGQVLVQGVVIDEAIRPIPAARVAVLGSDASATTGPDGAFQFALAPGAAVLEATHPRFAPVQQALQVVAPAAGQESPKVVLRFTFSAEQAPYMELTKFDGFVVCSLGVSVIFSEECGEGVGTPVGRVGKQGNNAIRHDFTADSPDLKSVVVEQSWEPTSEAGREMLVIFATAWTCEPACGGEAVGDGSMQGPSPLLMRADEDVLAPFLNDPATVFTTYTLARNDATQVNVLLNQAFQLFVSRFYRAPAPEGYSFVAGSGP